MIRKGYSVVLLAAIAVTGATVTAFACGDDKATSASNASSVKSAVAADHCAGKSSAKNTAVTANTVAEHCAKNSSAMAASAACCKAKGAKATATTAAKTTAITAVSAGSSCSASKGASAGYDAVVTGGSACVTKGVGAMTGNTHHNCDACADMAMCESELKSASSQYQVVPLKNGVMYVYTAAEARDVRSVQSAIARRTDRINSLVSAQSAKLCPDCKRMRGAMASGKLTREVVNIEGGSISLVTSSDPTMVTRLYAMAGLSGQKVVKS